MCKNNKITHDYRGKGIYLITLCTEQRKVVMGTLSVVCAATGNTISHAQHHDYYLTNQQLLVP